MLRFSKNGLSVSVVLDRRRIKVSGLYPVKVEVVAGRRQKYFSTGVDLSQEQWAEMSARHRRNAEMSKIEECFNRILNEVVSTSETSSFPFGTTETSAKGGSSVSVNRALLAMMDRYRTEGKVNSYYRCRSTLRNIEEFSGGNISFPSVTPEWLVRCDSFWRHQGKSDTTVGIYMKTLKCIFNQAVSQGYIRSSPFGSRDGYVIPRGAVRKLALPKSQIRKIIEYKGPERLEKYRDLWLFSYLCNGINFRDMLFLRYSNIANGEIRFVRSKTEYAYSGRKVICAVLRPEMQRIIERWGNPDNGSPDTLIFRFAEGNEDKFAAAMLVRRVICQCNTALKEIAGELGIPAFTTYSARHSFATVMQRSGVDLPFISESLGHSSLSVTETYLAGSSPDERLRNSALLLDFQ